MKKPTQIGIVTEVLPNLQFRVDINGKILLCYQAGKMKIQKIKVLLGDKVEVVHTPDMGDIGRIVWRR